MIYRQSLLHRLTLTITASLIAMMSFALSAADDFPQLKANPFAVENVKPVEVAPPIAQRPVVSQAVVSPPQFHQPIPTRLPGFSESAAESIAAERITAKPVSQRIATPIAMEASGQFTLASEIQSTPVTPPPAAIVSPAPASVGVRMVWWNELTIGSVLGRPTWVAFDLETVLMDTLRHSPRIQSVSHETSMALERIIQQDAAFDPSLLMRGTAGRSNEPVGNTLTTGGASRLREESISTRTGIARTTRRGGELGVNTELGTLDSNSQFFTPRDQGSARLSLSLTQPLLDRGGQVYNERLLTQARIDSRVSWQEMRGDVESRIADVIFAYWQLYETRCHLLQQRELLRRGERIERLLSGRTNFDSSRIELANARQRVARRQDQLIVSDAEVQKQQTRLATLIGSNSLCGTDGQLELIPQQSPIFPDMHWSIRDAMVQAYENRPEIKAATSELESAALAVKVTRVELLPQLNAVVNASLAALNDRNRKYQSLVDLTSATPGFSAGIEYEMPYGRRAANARHREAHHQYRRRSEQLREAMQETQWEVERAIIEVRRASAQQDSKQRLLQTAIEEETILTRRWEVMGGDGSRVGVILENLLDSQQRRTTAEREYVTSQTEYMTSLVELQRAMGTLLRAEGINPIRSRGSQIDFVKQFTGQPPAATISEITIPPSSVYDVRN